MKLEKFKERKNKKIGVVVFTLVCLFLVSGVILYRTFAIFEIKTNQNIINGQVQTGDILFTFYYENDDGKYVITDQIPEGDYVLSTSQSYCGFAGQNDENIKLSMSSDKTLEIEGLSKSSTKCNLYFEKNKNPLINIPIVTKENGLYEVKHLEEETNIMDPGWQQTEYRYAGLDPDNYVWFNCGSDIASGNTCEKWRIIGFVNVLVSQEEGKNKVEQRLKIIRNEDIGSMQWTSNGINDWTQTSLMKELNEINGEKGKYYQSLKQETIEMIDDNIIWNIGGINSSDYAILDAKGYYVKERGTGVFDGRPTTWPKDQDTVTKARVGLIYPSDYGYAVGGTNRETCLKTSLNKYNQNCYSTDWLVFSDAKNKWLLSPSSSSEHSAFIVHAPGEITFNGDQNLTALVRPTLYLSPSVSISGGTGTVEEPFELSV